MAGALVWKGLGFWVGLGSRAEFVQKKSLRQAHFFGKVWDLGDLGSRAGGCSNDLRKELTVEDTFPKSRLLTRKGTYLLAIGCRV